MIDLDMTTEVEAEDFTDELSDEALDRREVSGLYAYSSCISRP
jgi:hypothetical protein